MIRTKNYGMTTSTSSLEVHIVEDHDEALPHIYRALAKRVLPYSGNALIHFDSHPDLLSPDIKADDVIDTDQLYSRTSIADWILPAVYMGHIACIIWVKPPWAEQIQEGKHLLLVGKDNTSGEIRVATPLPYFLGEMLWVPRHNLLNVVEIPLEVVTLHPLPVSSPLLPISESQDQSQKSGSRLYYSDSDRQLLDHLFTGKGQCVCYQDSARDMSHSPPMKKAKTCSVCSAVSLVSSCIATATKCASWILDIDLDFFSTGNPYRTMFSAKQYYLVQKLYKLEEPADYNEEALCQCTSVRRKQLAELKQLWSTDTSPESCGTSVPSGSGDTHVSVAKDNGRTTDTNSIVADSSEPGIQLTSEEIKLVAEIKQYLWKYYEDCFVDADYLHTAGLVSDLPIHVSDMQDIDGLVKGLQHVLLVADKKPSLVTISRSTEDEYTPAHQVEDIQERVLQTLQSSLEVAAGSTVQRVHLAVHQHYLDDSSSSPPEKEQSPSSP